MDAPNNVSSSGKLTAGLLPLLLVGCAGGNMLAEGKAAPALTAARDIQGRSTELVALSETGPVVLVFLRGFS